MDNNEINIIYVLTDFGYFGQKTFENPQICGIELVLIYLLFQ